MNVLVIGGAGFIGSHICRTFLKHGNDVTVFGPPLQEDLLKDMEANIQRIDGDILDAPSIFKAFHKAKPDVVIHLAAFGEGKDGVAKSAQLSPKKALDVNVMGFYHVLEAAAICGVSKVIWSSSTTVFGPEEKYGEEKLQEDAAVSPIGFYGSTKVMNEFMTRYYRSERNLCAVGVRLPLVYGPGRWYKGAASALVDIFEGSLSSGEVVVKGGTESIDLMYIKDVADVFYHLATTKEPLDEVYHVKSHTTSLHEIVETVRALLPNYHLQLNIQEPAMVYPLIDCSKIEKELGFVPKYSVLEACGDYLYELSTRRGV